MAEPLASIITNPHFPPGFNMLVLTVTTVYKIKLDYT